MPVQFSKSRTISAIGLIAALAGCAGSADGPKFTDTNLTGPKTGTAQIVFFRPPKWAGSYRAPEVDVNGAAACDLPNRGAFVYEVPPGSVTVALSHWDMPGTTQVTFNADRDKTYYVRVDANEGKIWPSMFAGLVGLFVAEAVSPNKGPYVLNVMDRTPADPELAEIRMADCKLAGTSTPDKSASDAPVKQ